MKEEDYDPKAFPVIGNAIDGTPRSNEAGVDRIGSMMGTLRLPASNTSMLP